MDTRIPIYQAVFDVPEGTTHVRIGGAVIELAGVIDSATGVIYSRPGARNNLRLTPLAEQWLAENPEETAPTPKKDDCGCGKPRAKRKAV